MIEFGTDGLRGLAGTFPIDLETFYKLGVIIGGLSDNHPVVVAQDPRESSAYLAKSFMEGVCATGVNVICIGVVPTPMIPSAMNDYDSNYGVMITASHNPFHDNGIKVFGKNGFKLSDHDQHSIQEKFNRFEKDALPLSGVILNDDDAAYRYFHKNTTKLSVNKLLGQHIMIDAAFGAAAGLISKYLRDIGLQIVSIHDHPDPLKINQLAGVMGLSVLESHLLEKKYQFALAFDGDADRVVIYENGQKIDPHYILLMLNEYYMHKHDYRGGIVGTILHNRAIIRYCQLRGIPWFETPVGDRHLIQKCIETGALIAGEPSGHYVLMDCNPTADGLMTALILMEGLIDGVISSYSWYLDHVPLDHSYSVNVATQSSPQIITKNQQFIEYYEKLRKDFSHLMILVRPSGTESVVRVHVEGAVSTELLEDIAREIVNSIRMLDEAQENYSTELEASLD